MVGAEDGLETTSMEDYNDRRVRYYDRGAHEYDGGWRGSWLPDEGEREEHVPRLRGTGSPDRATRVAASASIKGLAFHQGRYTPNSRSVTCSTVGSAEVTETR